MQHPSTKPPKRYLPDNRLPTWRLPDHHNLIGHTTTLPANGICLGKVASLLAKTAGTYTRHQRFQPLPALFKRKLFKL